MKGLLRLYFKQRLQLLQRDQYEEVAFKSGYSPVELSTAPKEAAEFPSAAEIHCPGRSQTGRGGAGYRQRRRVGRFPAAGKVGPTGRVIG